MSEVRQRLENDLTSVRAAIDAGRLDDASLVLSGLSLNAPPSSEFSKEIGDLFLRLGFPAMAGRYWYLLDDKSDQMLAACKEFEHSLGDNPVLISHVFLLCSVNDSSPQVRARFQELQAKADDFGRTYQYPWKPERGWRDRIALLGCGIVATVVILVFVMGLFSVAEIFQRKGQAYTFDFADSTRE